MGGGLASDRTSIPRGPAARGGRALRSPSPVAPPFEDATRNRGVMTTRDLDTLLDPRVRVFLHAQPVVAVSDVKDRDEILAEVASKEGRAMLLAEAVFMNEGDSEDVAPS